MSVVQWNDLSKVQAPIGETILLSNSVAKVTTVGIATWEGKTPFPVFTACDPSGFGRFKPTHWASMPEAAP